MPSRGLVSLQRAASLLLSHTHHFHSEVKTKAHHGTDDSDLIFFDIILDSVTLTEPGLAVLGGFVWMYAFSNSVCRGLGCKCNFCICAERNLICTKCTQVNSWCDSGLSHSPFLHSTLLWFSKRLFSELFSCFPLLSNILPQSVATLSDGCLFRVGAGNWATLFKDENGFVTENCFWEHNADIFQIRNGIFTQLSKSSYYKTNRQFFKGLSISVLSSTSLASLFSSFSDGLSAFFLVLFIGWYTQSRLWCLTLENYCLASCCFVGFFFFAFYQPSLAKYDQWGWKTSFIYLFFNQKKGLWHCQQWLQIINLIWFIFLWL